MNKLRFIILYSFIGFSTNDCITDIVQKWAPLVWLAPGEQFFPIDVPKFLSNVFLEQSKSQKKGSQFLRTKDDLDTLLRNKTSFLYGINPFNNKIPVYAAVEKCNSPKLQALCESNKNINFHVTYWMFYPYNKGKLICMLNLKMMPIPMPTLQNECMGTYTEYGNHVGDWEHLSLFFEGDNYPSSLYISTHNVGAYYTFDRKLKQFRYKRQNVKRNIERPTFPPIISMYGGYHPIVFAANGSHGLWASATKHKYLRIPSLYDDTGYGVPWYTWKNVEIIDKSKPEYYWSYFKGKWGNRKFECHPLSNLIVSMCKNVDGPLGIYEKKSHFNC